MVYIFLQIFTKIVEAIIFISFKSIKLQLYCHYYYYYYIIIIIFIFIIVIVIIVIDVFFWLFFKYLGYNEIIL